MTHDEAETLLGAYALDATSDEERHQVEAHLAGCPRCQAELDAHREVAALMAGGLSDEVPARVWERVAAATAPGRATGRATVPPPALAPLAVPDGQRRLRHLPVARRPRAVAQGLGVVAGLAAAVAALVLGTEVGQLRSQVHRLQQQMGTASIANAAALAATGPHATVTLTAADGARAATVVVVPNGPAYWVSSTLATLPASETYQLWGLVRGKPVSLGLIGPDPSRTGAFRVGAGATKLMVTAEPAGGTPLPTTAVVAVGTVPVGALG